MKKLLFLFFLIIGAIAEAQVYKTAEVWITTGLKYELGKNTDIGLDLNERIGAYRLQTFFPEIYIKHKFTSYFKPSLEYRTVWDLKSDGRYQFGNRINLNFNFEYDLSKRLEASFRVRLQQGFSRLNSTDYSADFDNSLRFKPEIQYDLKGKKYTPSGGLEFFYNPQNSDLGNRFTRIRYFLGLDFNLSGPNELGIKYFFDQSINIPDPVRRHVYSISFTHTIKHKSEDEILKKELEELKKNKI